MDMRVAPARPPRNEEFETLTAQECLRLLALAGMGRVAVSVAALPAVLPVPFALFGNDVVFPAVPGGAVDVAVRNAVVAFEADSIDPLSGWSVVVTGIATEVTDPETIVLLEAIPAFHRPPGEHQFFRIPTEMVSGRRLTRQPVHVGGVVLSLAAKRPSPNGAAEATQPPWGGSHLEAIPTQECLALLASEEVGHLAVVLAGRPAVFPVNYALDGDAVVFRTAPGTKLEAVSRSLVAFQVDRWAPSGTGWSVVVEGFAQEVTSADAPGLRERLAALPLRPWAPGDRLHFVRIVPFAITGTRAHPTTNGNGGH
jgi:nitroimidazol reductase NimA-like FMN-containing flavoprotein (pyridoxamine 5'-phosphate oxidase superfamily)